MSDLLDRSINASLERMVADTPPAGPMPTQHLARPTTRQRRPWVLIAAAAVVLVGVAGIVAVATRDNQTSTPIGSSATGPVVRPAGIFPTGGVAGAIAARYATPVDAVSAYLASITDPGRVPAGYTISAKVADPPTTRIIDQDHATVGISLQTDGDTGDGSVTVQRVHTDPSAWQVVSAQVVGDETRNVQVAGGTMTGVIAPAAGGSTTLYAYDLTTGAILDATTVTTSTTPDRTDPEPVNFTLNVGAATQVGLRYWNTVAPAGG
ncbi:MAG: hypothetical protein ABIR68_03785, partial [Ilumatobacteraceae bacterium]